MFRCIKGRYFGYKMHLICEKNGIIHAFDFTLANVHDVNYPKDVKHNLSHCNLIGNSGHFSIRRSISDEC